MNSRRMFFRTLIGNAGALIEDMRGVECIPLNRLKELPEDIIKQIKPVFFEEEPWSVEDKTLILFEKANTKKLCIELTDIELQALAHFKKNQRLDDTASYISENTKSSFDEIYKTVTSLFFKLASLRICHPKEVYRIDEILKTTKQDGTL
jgi:hypothetical protein